MPSIAGYQIGRLLGRGTFGETYIANKGDQRVALKLIREEAIQRGYDIRRFQREVRALQRVIGPQVVRLLEAGEGQLGNETRFFLALEYLEGKDLAHSFINSGNRFNESELKNYLIQILLGLKTIHTHNIVHRDLKPANVFLTQQGQIKILDFGLVKMLDYTTLTTTPGQPIGTPQYIAPEILRGDQVDYRSDFYSLGVLIYYLVTRGFYPFIAQTPLELYVKVVNDPPTPPIRHNSRLSSEFENLILKLLSKQPYERTFNHQELTRAIQSTPLSIRPRARQTSTQRRVIYPKRCFFRLLHTERAVIERFNQNGGVIDGFVYPANYLPRYQNSLNAYREMGLFYLLDPVAYRLAYSSFAQTEGVVNLPYVPDRNNVLTPSALQTLQALQTYARVCIDWQIQWQCSSLVAPFHFNRNLGSPWLDIDVKLIEESVSYANTLQNSPPVYAGICLNIEAFTVSANRIALLNRYSRARAEGYLFYVDSIYERTTNPLQLRALLDMLQLFQQLGKPVFACRVGTLGLCLLAAGVDVMTTGIASLSSFSESNLLVNRAIGYDMSTKYYLPNLMLTLPVPMAEDILSDRRNSYLRCQCSYCEGTYRNLARTAKEHFIKVRTEEISQLNSLGSTEQRIEWFIERVETAIQACDNVRRQQIVHLQPGHYSHLRTWIQVLNSSHGDN